MITEIEYCHKVFFIVLRFDICFLPTTIQIVNLHNYEHPVFYHR